MTVIYQKPRTGVVIYCTICQLVGGPRHQALTVQLSEFSSVFLPPFTASTTVRHKYNL